MQKERLTLQNIQQDLKKDLKSTLTGLVMLSVLSVLMAVICAVMWSAVFWLGLVFGVFAVLLWIALVLEIGRVLVCWRVMNRQADPIKDTLIGMEIKDHYQRGRGVYQTYHLYFSCYGEYQIPCESYSWSSVYPLSEYGVYNYANTGDEFYLVLSKRHTGKILLVYSTELFDWQPHTES